MCGSACPFCARVDRILSRGRNKPCTRERHPPSNIIRDTVRLQVYYVSITQHPPKSEGLCTHDLVHSEKRSESLQDSMLVSTVRGT